MNVVFLSPAFPPTARLFCGALQQRGVNVIGIGDTPLSPESREHAVLGEYIFEPNMERYEVLRAVVEGIRRRHGSIDRIDSNGEHWLEAEARLRDDFDVPGLRTRDIELQRSKLGMAQVFGRAGIHHPPGIPAASPTEVRKFAAEHGFPLVLKPDKGSGAADTFALTTSLELEGALERPLQGCIVQPYIEGDIVTYDGLADKEGNIVFSTSHVYDVGIMQIRLGHLDGHYYSLRAVPPALEDVGRRAVAAFNVRERFFHVEFFARPDGSYVALEMNLRPPGGFTTDMMNAACDIDVYDLWATALTEPAIKSFSYERRYHTAHAGRRDERTYQVSHAELLRELGAIIFEHRPIPKVFSVTMGDTAYLLRHPDLDVLQRAIARVQAV